jgi:hypothetical protein
MANEQDLSPSADARVQIAADLEQLLAESELWASDPTAAFEQVAEQFYRETGFLAPGKSMGLIYMTPFGPCRQE